jgi:hypothetical protein
MANIKTAKTLWKVLDLIRYVVAVLATGFVTLAVTVAVLAFAWVFGVYGGIIAALVPLIIGAPVAVLAFRGFCEVIGEPEAVSGWWHALMMVIVTALMVGDAPTAPVASLLLVMPQIVAAGIAIARRRQRRAPEAYRVVDA